MVTPLRLRDASGLASVRALDRTLDPGLSGLAAALRRVAPDPAWPFEHMRTDFEATAAALAVPEDVTIERDEVAGRPAEVMVPSGPVLRSTLYFHGGAYTIGSIATVRALAARYAAATRTRLVSLDYRLAPEHPYPAAVVDAMGALAEVAASADGLPLVVAGDSAGGSLALQTALVAAAGSGPHVDAVVAMSPWTDLTLPYADAMDACEDAQAPRWLLERSADAYAGGEPGSPRHGKLASLPPALVQVGSAETLFDDGTAFAEAAWEAGAPVTLECWPGMPHVWQAFAPRLEAGSLALASADAWLSEVLGQG